MANVGQHVHNDSGMYGMLYVMINSVSVFYLIVNGVKKCVSIDLSVLSIPGTLTWYPLMFWFQVASLKYPCKIIKSCCD